MPKVGASQFFVALYHEDEIGRISYTDGQRAARLASWSLTLNSSDSNSDYLDNVEAETAGGEFSGGSLDVEIGEFTQEADRLILGAKRGTLMVNGEKVEGVLYNDNLTRPFLGAAFIEKRIIKGVTSWRPIVLLKTRFNIPDEQVETQGETISWQHDTIKASVLRAAGTEGNWRIYDDFESESLAAQFIKKIFHISALALEPLTVISVAGTAVGTTAVTADPEKSEDRSYRYQVGAAAALPAYNEDLSSWTAWNGVEDIPAAAGDKIVIAEVDASGLAMAAGITEATVKEE